ncbi:hypothetical protein VUR80DRAFT_8417 [Thermomyces stellatus]
MMNMELSPSQTLKRELEDIQKRKQELQMLEEHVEERERLVREKLVIVNSSSGPVAINNSQVQVQQHGTGLSVSPGNSYYELAGFDGSLYQHSPESAKRATVGMTPRSQSNMGVSSFPPKPNTNMARSRSSISALSCPISRSVSQASDLSWAPHATNSLYPGTNAGMMDRLYENEPANLQNLGSQFGYATDCLPDVQKDPLANLGQNPVDFLKSTEDEGNVFEAASFPGFYYNPNPASDYFQYPTSVMASTPSLVGSDSAAPEATPLTRDNSSVGESFVGALGFTPLDSTNLPIVRAASQDQFPHDIHPNPGAKQTSIMDNASPPTLGANPTATLSQSYTSPDPPHSSEMYRSTSNTSTKSTASNQERRAKEARERQIQNGLRNGNIAPRPPSEEKKTPNPTHLSLHTAKKEAKPAGGAKTQYQRPKHPKVFCDKCTDHPEGFRGEHELRRHTSSKHSDTVIKWVCRDPGAESNISAVNPLSKCKACLAKKQYGAYYNAAAHLRRAHFRKRASRGRRGGEKSEGRAGKGGGDWPPMAELKHWMRKVRVRNNTGVEEVEEPEALSKEVERMTYGNGGALDFSGLDASTKYPPMLPELTVSTTDGPPAEGFMQGNSEPSPFSSASSMSPQQQELSFDDPLEEFVASSNSQAISPGMPYMGFSPMEEYGMSTGGV